MTADRSSTAKRENVVARAYLEFSVDEREKLGSEIDEIFFEASSVQSFADAAAREAFRWRWLGRYLVEEPEHAFVALTEEGNVVGYLVGSLRDPAARPKFSELSYFRDFANLTAEYPAHLHVNVARAWRSAGVGAHLVAAFAAHADRHGAVGMHIVTGVGLRNVRFYERLGFAAVGEAPYKGGRVVMLGARLPL